MTIKGIKHAITPDGWRRLGLAPSSMPAPGSIISASASVSLTPREMVALCRWDHMIYLRARYDAALGVSLATKGVVAIVGWIADEETSFGEMAPDWMLLLEAGPLDTRDGKIHAEIHALCELTAIGRNLLKHNLETMKRATGYGYVAPEAPRPLIVPS